MLEVVSILFFFYIFISSCYLTCIEKVQTGWEISLDLTNLARFQPATLM